MFILSTNVRNAMAYMYITDTTVMRRIFENTLNGVLLVAEREMVHQ